MKKDYKVIAIILIIVSFIAGFFISRHINNKNKCTDNAINTAKGLTDNYNGKLKLGIYNISKYSNSDEEEENDYAGIGFEFKENNIVYITDEDEAYMTGKYEVNGNNIVCKMNELYILNDEENSEDYKKIDDTATFKLEINESESKVKIIEKDIKSEIYTNTMHLEENEYTYDILENN